MTLSVEKAYSQALYEAALSDGKTKRIYDELSAVSKLFLKNSDYQRLLDSPLISKEEKRGLIDEAFSGRADEYIVNFLKVLCDNGRMSLFCKIAEEYEKRFNSDNGILKVQAITAQPLDGELFEKLRKKLEQISGKRVVLENTTEPGLLGGVILKAGGRQLDATVRSQLLKLRDKLRGNNM